MASLNLPKLVLDLIFVYVICCNAYTSFASPSLPHKIRETTTFKLSTIAAEPSVLPYSPLSPSSPLSPDALSPDITPLFPTTPTTASNPPSSETSLPIIPSSPSPPNPDSLSTPNPDSSLPSISPTGSMIPESSAFASKLSVVLNTSMVILLFIAFW